MIEIRWTGSGLTQRFAGPIAADSIYEIREGNGALVPIRPAQRPTQASR